MAPEFAGDTGGRCPAKDGLTCSQIEKRRDSCDVIKAVHKRVAARVKSVQMGVTEPASFARNSCIRLRVCPNMDVSSFRNTYVSNDRLDKLLKKIV